jgi:hypothetical protein
LQFHLPHPTLPTPRRFPGRGQSQRIFDFHCENVLFTTARGTKEVPPTPVLRYAEEPDVAVAHPDLPHASDLTVSVFKK